MRAFLKTQVIESPAAASIEKSTPADVGAAKRPARSASFHASPDDAAPGGPSTKTKYAAAKIQGKAAAVAATT